MRFCTTKCKKKPASGSWTTSRTPIGRPPEQYHEPHWRTRPFEPRRCRVGPGTAKPTPRTRHDPPRGCDRPVLCHLVSQIRYPVRRTLVQEVPWVFSDLSTIPLAHQALKDQFGLGLTVSDKGLLSRGSARKGRLKRLQATSPVPRTNIIRLVN